MRKYKIILESKTIDNFVVLEKDKIVNLLFQCTIKYSLFCGAKNTLKKFKFYFYFYIILIYSCQKIIFKNIYYFNIFLNKKHFKK